MIDLNKLCTKSLDDAITRAVNGANVKIDTRSMLKHCSTEVVEAMEAYTKWVAYSSKNQFESELADIIVCCLIIAGNEEIDIENAIKDCIEKNHKRAEMIGDKL